MHRVIRRRYFTLIELLAVIVVVFILVGIVLGVVTYATQMALDKRTRATIAAMELAFQAYYTQHGYYPPNNCPDTPAVDHSLPEVVASDKDINWVWIQANLGPHLNLTDTQLSVASGLDPYGNWYHYQMPGIMNDGSFDLWSVGKDGKHGHGGSGPADALTPAADNSDDIANWK